MKDQTLTRSLARYEQSPHLVFWETTKACALACHHCRASAQHAPDPRELDTTEGIDLLHQIAAFGKPTPIVIFTGGDCFERGDLLELMDEAQKLGLRMGIAPSVTPLLTKDALHAVYGRGIRSVSISLDGASASSHDALRGVPGHFDETLRALSWISEMGFRLQVNTTVLRSNADELADVVGCLKRAGVAIWEVFFLIGVGRGAAIEEVTPQDAHDICHFLVDVMSCGITVRTVEGPFFRRVLALRSAYTGSSLVKDFQLGRLYCQLRNRLESLIDGIPKPRLGTTLATGDGRGVIFVGHDGAVHASGFLPLQLGNIREQTLQDVYQNSDTLQRIRHGQLNGACGSCTYRRLCGGSRARAYAHSGDVMGSDPACLEETLT